MSSEKFCLRWNDFESNISVAFRELREEKDFFDVTLACDDSQVSAHKVILSACSPFFRNILRRNPHQHPLLYLKNVKFSDLQSVLNFMYQGEVNVAQEELNSFLAVAEDLRVKGLTQNNSGTSSSSTDHASKQRAPSPKISRPPAPPERDPVPPPECRRRLGGSSEKGRLVWDAWEEALGLFQVEREVLRSWDSGRAAWTSGLYWRRRCRSCSGSDPSRADLLPQPKMS